MFLVNLTPQELTSCKISCICCCGFNVSSLDITWFSLTTPELLLSLTLNKFFSEKSYLFHFFVSVVYYTFLTSAISGVIGQTLCGSVVVLEILRNLPLDSSSWKVGGWNEDSSCDLSETIRKLCLSKECPHKEIRWNYGILRSVTCLISNLFLTIIVGGGNGKQALKISITDSVSFNYLNGMFFYFIKITTSTCKHWFAGISDGSKIGSWQ